MTARCRFEIKGAVAVSIGFLLNCVQQFTALFLLILNL